MLRFNISHNQAMNPKNIQFNNKNLPLFRVKVPQQTDNISCGYYVLRNMIGIYVRKEQIFPIVVKDFTGGDRTCDEYKTCFANFPSTDYKLKDKITRKKLCDILLIHPRLI